ncbi:MAG: hypothetical protein HY831_00160 [Candidatus Aenigmarchaeota archaeon]|nr:hypothetical protein [Candidatus Aenigmarchaeota archaeon]
MRKHFNTNWKFLIILIIFVIALLISISFDINFQVNSDGLFKAKLTCYDTDNGLNFTKTGSVSIFYGRDPSTSHLDECRDDKLIEYYCDDSLKDKYSIVVKDCNCLDGRCVID